LNSWNKQSYVIGFYFNEAMLLKQFLTYSLNSVFEAQRVEMIKKLKNNPKEEVKISSKSEVMQDSDLW
jgi:hypothetical protein